MKGDSDKEEEQKVTFDQVLADVQAHALFANVRPGERNLYVDKGSFLLQEDRLKAAKAKLKKAGDAEAAGVLRAI